MHGMLELSHCVTDGDPEALRRACHLQRFGFGASAALQAALLILVVIFTVASPAILPRIVPVMTAPFQPPPPPIVQEQPPQSRRVYTLGTARAPVFGRHTQVSTVGDLEPPTLIVGNQIPDVFGPGGIGITKDGEPPKPAEPVRTAPLQVSSGVMEGMLISRIQPAYPKLARLTHQSGRVELRAVIARDGTVRSVEVVSGNPLLVKPAADAVLRWRYRPTLLDGAPVEVVTFVTVVFVLH